MITTKIQGSQNQKKKFLFTYDEKYIVLHLQYSTRPKRIERMNANPLEHL